MSKARVVIIDNLTSEANYFEDISFHNKYEVYFATSGRDGINICKDVLPDVVITNILMPEIDGFEVILYLKKYFPSIKIIAISNGGFLTTENYLTMAKELGADVAITKPVTKAKLCKQLNELVFQLI